MAAKVREGRRKGRRKVTYNAPAELVAKVKMRAFEEGVTVTQYMTEALLLRMRHRRSVIYEKRR